MISQLTAALLASFALTPQTDTTFAVDASGRLELSHMEGSVAVSTWDRAELRLIVDHEEGSEVEIRTSGSTVRIEVTGEWGEPVFADFEITLPRTMAIELSGITMDVAVDGAGSDVSVQCIEGDIEVVGGDGNIALNSVSGAVSLRGAKGNIALNSVDGGVTVADARGNLAVQAVDGAVELNGIVSDHVEVNTVDGDITYDGTIADGGRYFLSTHDGNLYVTIPEGTNARVSVATFSGELDSDFPITIEGDVGKRRLSFTLGTGKAHVELSAFDGLIQLVRP